MCHSLWNDSPLLIVTRGNTLSLDLYGKIFVNLQMPLWAHSLFLFALRVSRGIVYFSDSANTTLRNRFETLKKYTKLRKFFSFFSFCLTKIFTLSQKSGISAYFVCFLDKIKARFLFKMYNKNPQKARKTHIIEYSMI